MRTPNPNKQLTRRAASIIIDLSVWAAVSGAFSLATIPIIFSFSDPAGTTQAVGTVVEAVMLGALLAWLTLAVAEIGFLYNPGRKALRLFYHSPGTDTPINQKMRKRGIIKHSVLLALALCQVIILGAVFAEWFGPIAPFIALLPIPTFVVVNGALCLVRKDGKNLFDIFSGTTLLPIMVARPPIFPNSDF